MYKVGHFLEQDRDKLIAFMQAHPFAVLIGAKNHIPSASQIPLQVKIVGDEIKLIGHVMRKTDHHLAFVANEHVLVLFQGAHAYVSASVYEQPASASTWNYSSVQARGTVKLLDDAGTRKAIEYLTNQYEGEHSPAAFHQMSEEYIVHHLKAIVGIEITVTELEGVFKLSQNHSERNKKGIVDYLSQSEDVQAHEVAEEMRKKG